MRLMIPALCLSAFALAACEQNKPVDEAANAGAPSNELVGNDVAQLPAMTVDFMGSDNMARGSVTMADTPDGVTLTLAGMNLPAGQHGIHLHTTGKCEGPKFESAGSHLNPAGKKHGLENPDGSHLGDLPNIMVGTDGTVKQQITVKGTTLADFKEADGTALVIHAKPDDNKTDPSGDSGDRIACAVLSPGA